MVRKRFAELMEIKGVRYRSYYPFESREVYLIGEGLLSVDDY